MASKLELLLILKAQDKVSGALGDLGKAFGRLEGTTRSSRGMLGKFGETSVIVAGQVAKLVTGLTVGLGAAIGAVGVKSVQAASDYESAFAGVIKTTEGLVTSTGELTEMGEQLHGGFRNLAQEIPSTTTELASIGEIGGQLGIPEEALLQFTRTVADLGVATNLSTNQAGTALARVSNIFDVSSDEMGGNIERLGSTIVDLGNNFATTEEEIAGYTQRMAGAGKIVGMTQADMMGLAAASSALGISVEAGGTAIQRVMLTIQKAMAESGTGADEYQAEVTKLSNKLETLHARLDAAQARYNELSEAGKDGTSTMLNTEATITNLNNQIEETSSVLADLSADGGGSLEQFASVAGMTAANFTKLWETDASEAFTRFVEGLGEAGTDAITMLEAMELSDVRVARSMLSMAGAGDLVRSALERASGAWEENTALTIEAERRYGTFDSQMITFKNRIKDVGLSIGTALLPMLSDLLEKLGPIITKFGEQVPEAMDKMIEAIGTLVKAFQEGGFEELGEQILTMAGASEETKEMFSKLVDFLTTDLLPLLLQLSVDFMTFAEDVSDTFTKVRTAVEPVITALVEGFKGLAENLAPIKDSFAEFAESMGEAAPGLEIIAKAVGDLAGGILLVFGELLPELGTVFATMVDTTLELITDLVEFLSGAAVMLKGLFTGDLETARAGAKTVLESLVKMFADTLGGGLAAVGDIVGGVAEKLAGLGEVAEKIFSPIANLADKVSELGNALKNLSFENLNLSGIGNLVGDIGSDIGGLFSGQAGTNLAGRQHGGPVTQASPYIVGETGPELFVPERSGRIEPTVPGGGAQTINLVVDGKVLASIVNEHLGRSVGNRRRMGGHATI